MSNIDRLRDEYLDATANMRHYSNLRFLQLTVFVAVTGGLIAILSGTDTKTTLGAELLVKGIGVLMSVAFLFLEIRIVRHWEYHRHRAEELEDVLGLRQFKCRPRYTWINGRNAAYMIFVGIGTFWLVTVVWDNSIQF